MIDPDTRSVRARTEVDNPFNLLKPGMFVRVAMDLGEVETFVVPANTVLQQEGTNQRFVFISKSNVGERIEVTLGKRFDDQLEIISESLKVGDMLVKEGQAKLISGDKLEINN